MKKVIVSASKPVNASTKLTRPQINAARKIRDAYRDLYDLITTYPEGDLAPLFNTEDYEKEIFDQYNHVVNVLSGN